MPLHLSRFELEPGASHGPLPRGFRVFIPSLVGRVRMAAAAMTAELPGAQGNNSAPAR